MSTERSDAQQQLDTNPSNSIQCRVAGGTCVGARAVGRPCEASARAARAKSTQHDRGAPAVRTRRSAGARRTVAATPRPRRQRPSAWRAGRRAAPRSHPLVTTIVCQCLCPVVQTGSHGVLRPRRCAASARVVGRGRRAVRGAKGVRAAAAPLHRQEGPGDGASTRPLFQTDAAADASATPCSCCGQRCCCAVNWCRRWLISGIPRDASSCATPCCALRATRRMGRRTTANAFTCSRCSGRCGDSSGPSCSTCGGASGRCCSACERAEAPQCCAQRAAPRGALAAHPHSRKRTALPRPAAPARVDAARARRHGLGHP